jgi:hypothetical protein
LIGFVTVTEEAIEDSNSEGESKDKSKYNVLHPFKFEKRLQDLNVVGRHVFGPKTFY